MSLIRRMLADRGVRDGGDVEQLEPWAPTGSGLGSWDERFVELPAPQCARRLYAIGDLHGRRDLLDQLLLAIERDVLRSPEADYKLVFLGDYVDRGDDSRAVVSRLIEVQIRLNELDQPPVFLLGNHEELMLQFLDDPLRAATWLDYGGVQTLASYGVGLRGRTADDLAAAAAQFRRAIAPHMSFLRELETNHVDGNIFCCHAAVEPDLPLDLQPREVLLWGDSTFRRRGGPPGHTVVHGHTITTNVDVGRNRVGVDTGAYASGRLSALRVDPREGYAVIST